MQGSQYVGMLKSCLDIPAVEKMRCPKLLLLLLPCSLVQANSRCNSPRLEKAESILGWSVKKFCLEGPAVPWRNMALLCGVARVCSWQEQIEQTKYCQPIMLLPQSKLLLLLLLLCNISCCKVCCRCCWDRAYEADVTGLETFFTSCSISCRCPALPSEDPGSAKWWTECRLGRALVALSILERSSMPFPGRGWLESRRVHRALPAAQYSELCVVLVPLSFLTRRCRRAGVRRRPVAVAGMAFRERLARCEVCSW